MKRAYRECLAGQLGLPQLRWLLDRLPSAYLQAVLETPAKDLLTLESPEEWIVLETEVARKQEVARILMAAAHIRKTYPPKSQLFK